MSSVKTSRHTFHERVGDHPCRPCDGHAMSPAPKSLAGQVVVTHPLRRAGRGPLAAGAHARGLKQLCIAAGSMHTHTLSSGQMVLQAQGNQTRADARFQTCMQQSRRGRGSTPEPLSLPPPTASHTSRLPKGVLHLIQCPRRVQQGHGTCRCEARVSLSALSERLAARGEPGSRRRGGWVVCGPCSQSAR